MISTIFFWKFHCNFNTDNPPPDHDDDPIGGEATPSSPIANNQVHMSPESENLAAQGMLASLLKKNPVPEDSSGAKRHHSLEHSDSDKDAPCIVENSSLVLISSSPTQGEWRKVEKKKGRKS